MVAVQVYNDARVHHLPRLERVLEHEFPVRFTENDKRPQLWLEDSKAGLKQKVFMKGDIAVVLVDPSDRGVTTLRIRKAVRLLVAKNS